MSLYGLHHLILSTYLVRLVVRDDKAASLPTNEMEARGGGRGRNPARSLASRVRDASPHLHPVLVTPSPSPSRSVCVCVCAGFTCQPVVEDGGAAKAMCIIDIAYPTYQPRVLNPSFSPLLPQPSPQPPPNHQPTPHIPQPKVPIPPPATMHGSSCPKCGASSDGSSKACGSCGAVGLLPYSRFDTMKKSRTDG
ncbi:hypothetical protein B0T18DRAFT_211476 [Schizothecium vesticola]|uniref:Uncharacterized protein n=1 Tax=Schizothecium vesticola TaxID=314040 RepID=A0AA40EJN8_9PEZI|nr:hypothetical protein B0T18DRAFT_211476 [Schizothecium vesticola]